MSFNSRIAKLVAALTAVVVLGVTVASASALRFTQTFTNWPVTGSLEVHKLNQTITVPPGSTFNGNGDILIESTGITGSVTGATVVPPVTAPITILGIPTIVGLTFTEVGTMNGSIVSALPADCAAAIAGSPETCVTLSLPFEANIGITSVALGPLKLPTKCETKEPVSFSLSTHLTALEIILVGSHFQGTTTLPNIKCSGLFGGILGPILSHLFSGPENKYVLNIKPPTV